MFALMLPNEIGELEMQSLSVSNEIYEHLLGHSESVNYTLHDSNRAASWLNTQKNLPPIAAADQWTAS